MVHLRQDVCYSCRLRLSLIAKRRVSTPARRTTIRSITTKANLTSPKGPKNAHQRLPNFPARTRFAPSPTGYLHLGSLRTALFNYLLARSTGGQFVLRIEDTDSNRTVPNAESRLYEDLQWAGLEWDEGPTVLTPKGGPFGPYKQSERTVIYQNHARDLVTSGHAYRCFCSSQRLHELATFQNSIGLGTGYDRRCAALPKDQSDERAANGESYVVRLRMNTDDYPFFDTVYGNLGAAKSPSRSYQPADGPYADAIILKSDGHPTYHLANVVDDHLMKITHVIRGSEWLSSTPKHLAIYDAFGWEPPQFAHVGLLVNAEQAKLSKRDFDVDISSYRDKLHILPEALNNFVALLGWSHTSPKDVMSMADMIKNFSLRFTKGNTIVTTEKLWYMQKVHAQRQIDGNEEGLSSLAKAVADALAKRGLTSDEDLMRILNGRTLQQYAAQALKLDSRNFLNPEDFVTHHSYLFTSKHRSDSGVAPQLNQISGINSDQLFLDEEVTLQALRNLFDSDVADTHARIDQLAASSLVELKFWDEESIRSSLRTAQTEAWHARQRIQGLSSNMQRQVSAALFHFLRKYLTFGHEGPGIGAVMAVLGKEESMRRLSAGIVAELSPPMSSKSIDEIDPQLLIMWVWLGRPVKAPPL